MELILGQGLEKGAGERENVERESGWEWDDQEGPTLALASVARATYTNAKSRGSPPL